MRIERAAIGDERDAAGLFSFRGLGGALADSGLLLAFTSGEGALAPDDGACAGAAPGRRGAPMGALAGVAAAAVLGGAGAAALAGPEAPPTRPRASRSERARGHRRSGDLPVAGHLADEHHPARLGAALTEHSLRGLRYSGHPWRRLDRVAGTASRGARQALRRPEILEDLDEARARRACRNAVQTACRSAARAMAERSMAPPSAVLAIRRIIMKTLLAMLLLAATAAQRRRGPTSSPRPRARTRSRPRTAPARSHRSTTSCSSSTRASSRSRGTAACGGGGLAQGHPRYRLVLEGYTDASGSRTYNEDLATSRAAARALT